MSSGGLEVSLSIDYLECLVFKNNTQNILYDFIIKKIYFLFTLKQ